MKDSCLTRNAGKGSFITACKCVVTQEPTEVLVLAKPDQDLLGGDRMWKRINVETLKENSKSWYRVCPTQGAPARLTHDMAS